MGLLSSVLGKVSLSRKQADKLYEFITLAPVVIEGLKAEVRELEREVAHYKRIAEATKAELSADHTAFEAERKSWEAGIDKLCKELHETEAALAKSHTLVFDLQAELEAVQVQTSIPDDYHAKPIGDLINAGIEVPVSFVEDVADDTTEPA